MQFIDFISCAYDMLTSYIATARCRAFLPCRWWCAVRPGATFARRPVPLASPEAAFLHAGSSRSSIHRPRPAPRAAQERHPRRGLRAPGRAQVPLSPHQGKKMPRGDHLVPIGKAGSVRREAPLDHHLRGDGLEVAGGGGAAGQGGRARGRDPRPPVALPMDDEAIVQTIKKTNRALVVHEDHGDRRHRRGDHGADQRALFQWLNRAGAAGGGATHPAPLCTPAGRFRAPADVGGHRPRRAVAGEAY